MPAIKVIGKLGDEAFLDSTQGLIACTVVGASGPDLIVDFGTEAPYHWSGMTINAWRGRKGERFPRSMIVPARAVRHDRLGAIGPYEWKI